jgi:polyvinyl alcohol dehydrogenase (cytochrome)
MLWIPRPDVRIGPSKQISVFAARLRLDPRNGNQAGYAVFFGDQRANAYAIDTVTGKLIWKRKVDEYPTAAITGAPTVQDGKVFVPVQGLQEEGSGGRGQTPCCRFRGSLTALNADTGAIVWKTYIVDEPKLRGINTRSGQEAYGPAGGAIAERQL